MQYEATVKISDGINKATKVRVDTWREAIAISLKDSPIALVMRTNESNIFN